MKVSFKHLLALTLVSTLLLQFNFERTVKQTSQPLHFVQGVNGQEILANADKLIKNNKQNRAFLGLKQKFAANEISEVLPVQNQYQTVNSDLASEGDSVTELSQINPKLVNLWNNTSMVFGASADGIGIGSSFLFKKLSDQTQFGNVSASSALLVTNLHVVLPFCSIPQNIVNDQVPLNDRKYSCHSLFILHDIAIDTQSKKTTQEGNDPWKSEVRSLFYFDKKLDLAIFAIDLPATSSALMVPNEVVTDYDIKRPVFNIQTALLKKPSEEAKEEAPSAGDINPIEAYELFLVSYNTPGSSDNNGNLIKKSWRRGNSAGMRAFETDQRLGLISAIKHSIEIKSGSSGSPLALSDGRIVGINASLEMNQFYGSSGCSKEELETHVSYYAIPSVYLKSIIFAQDEQRSNP